MNPGVKVVASFWQWPIAIQEVASSVTSTLLLDTSQPLRDL